MNCQYIPLELLSSSSSGKVSLGSALVQTTIFPQELLIFSIHLGTILLWLLNGPGERREASTEPNGLGVGVRKYWSKGPAGSLLGERVCIPFPNPIFPSLPSLFLLFFSILSLFGAGSHFIDQNGLELTQFHLCLPTKC